MTRVIGGRVARSFVLAALTIVGVLSSPSPGAAAASSAPDLRFCLKYSNNKVYAAQPVYLYWWDGLKWQVWKSGRSGADGCGTFRDVVPNHYYAVQGYWAMRTANGSMTIWSGFTPHVRVGNNPGPYETGRGTVSDQSVAW